jgi:hypothetical protein
MNDMAAPRSSPPTDHARHDGLLIAQLAAGDPLPAEQRLEASRLLDSCPDCARLAADLRTLPAVIAWEPLPSRRRDFRLDPGRARELRGTAVERFLRRLSLPGTAPLRPLAAGVLSIGLLFMVAGAAWPDGGSSGTVGQPAASGAALQQADTLAAPAALASPAARADRIGAAAAGGSSPAAERGMELYSDESIGPAPLSDTAGSDMAGSAAGDARERMKAAPEPTAGAEAAGAPNAAAADADGLSSLAEVRAPSPDVAAEAPLTQMTLASPVASDQAASNASVALDADQQALPVESLLLLVGALLALAGGGLLLLAWLARRRTDPLLR